MRCRRAAMTLWAGNSLLCDFWRHFMTSQRLPVAVWYKMRGIQPEIKVFEHAWSSDDFSVWLVSILDNSNPNKSVNFDHQSKLQHSASIAASPPSQTYWFLNTAIALGSHEWLTAQKPTIKRNLALLPSSTLSPLNSLTNSGQENNSYCQNFIVAIILSSEWKCFLYLDYFLITKLLVWAKQYFCHQEII